MKVLVFGNVGSGKTTFINRLRVIYPFRKTLIDDFRKEYGDCTMDKEMLARNKFLAAAKKNENQFIECLGVGSVADKLFEVICSSNELIICIVLVSSRHTCLSRLSDRNWDIPFPHSIDKVNSLVERTEYKIANNEIEELWGRRASTIVLVRHNELTADLENIMAETTAIIQKHL